MQHVICNVQTWQPSSFGRSPGGDIDVFCFVLFFQKCMWVSYLVCMFYKLHAHFIKMGTWNTNKKCVQLIKHTFELEIARAKWKMCIHFKKAHPFHLRGGLVVSWVAKLWKVLAVNLLLDSGWFCISYTKRYAAQHRKEGIEYVHTAWSCRASVALQLYRHRVHIHKIWLWFKLFLLYLDQMDRKEWGHQKLNK